MVLVGDGGVVDEGSAPEIETPTPDGGEVEQTEAQPEGSAPEGEAEGTDVEPEEWRNLTGKLGIKEFNTEAKARLAREHWDAKSQLSTMSRELAQAREQLEQMRSRPPQPTEPEEPELPHPDIQQIDETLSSLQEHAKALEAHRADILREWNIAGQRLAVANHLLQTAGDDPYAKDQAQRAVDQWSAEQNRLKLSYQESGHLLQKNAYDVKRAQSDRAYTEKLLASERVRLQEEQRRDAEFMRSFPVEVDGHVDRIASELKVDPKYLDDLKELTRESLMVRFSLMGGQPVEKVLPQVPAMVKEAMEKHIKRFKMTASADLKTVSRDKLQVTRQLGAAPVQPSKRPAANGPDQSDPAVRDSIAKLENARKKLGYTPMV